jgi:hypothetical protein
VRGRVRRHFLGWAALVLVTSVLMLPRLASPQFGLLDDGFMPVAAAMLGETISGNNPRALFHIDAQTGRFRPLYWAGVGAQYLVLGSHPLPHFALLGLGLIVTALLVGGAVTVATGHHLAGVLAGLAFVLSPPVIENYYTLSKAEPGFVLWLAASVFLYYRALDVAEQDASRSRRRLAGAALALLPAYFWKETAHAMLIVSGLWAIAAWCRDRGPSRRLGLALGYLAANGACAAAYWMAVELSGVALSAPGTYGGHYAPAAATALQSALRHLAFYVRDFPLLLIAGGVWAARAAASGGPSGTRWLALDWLSWIIGWTVIMLPWRATFEYYLLPAALGISAATGIFLNALVTEVGHRAPAMRWIARGALGIGLGLTAIAVLNSATNARVQLAVDRANAHLVDLLASRVPPDGTVLLDLPEPNEYVGEVGQHLAFFRGRGDVTVGHLRPGEDPSGTLVATPVMRNRPRPVVRIAVDEWASRMWLVHASARAFAPPTLVGRPVERVPLLQVALQQVACPLLVSADVRDEALCATSRPLIDRRVFEYGWEVYAVEPRRAAAQLR